MGFVTAVPGQIGKWLLHDSCANKNPYPHDRRADESPYPHDRHAYKAYSPHNCNTQCLIIRLQIKMFSVLILLCTMFLLFMFFFFPSA